MFKLKKNWKTIIPGDFLNAIFTHGSSDINDPRIMMWKMLAYDKEDQTYRRSNTSNDDSEMYTIFPHNTYSHIDIMKYINKGDWKIVRYDK